MRRILLVAATAVTTYRDSSGHIIGTGTTDSSSTTTFRDGPGRTIGTATAPRGRR